jgi:hypothetical protein
MVGLLLLCAMLFQCGTQAALKPVIDNDRVAVWYATDSDEARPLDAVVVSASGNAAFVPKGTAPKVSGRSLIIELKDHPVAPIANPTKYPLGFPRPGSKKLLENDRVIVWDYTWQPGTPTPMHFHDKDVVAWFLEDGDLKSTTPDGKEAVTQYTSGTVRFNQRDRTHSETLVKGKQRAIITELK